MRFVRPFLAELIGFQKLRCTKRGLLVYLKYIPKLVSIVSNLENEPLRVVLSSLAVERTVAMAFRTGRRKDGASVSARSFSAETTSADSGAEPSFASPAVA